MAIKSEANTLSTTSELIYSAVNGASGTPAGVEVWNNDASITVYIGGPDVSTANGLPILAQSSRTVDMISGSKLYAVAASGTPEIRVFQTRV